MKSSTAKVQRVLVVEDSNEERQLAVAAFQDAGYQVLCAADGIDAIRLAFAEEPDAIVTNVGMPEINGYLVCRFLREARQFKETPIVILTALREHLDRFWGKQCGADRYLVKKQGDYSPVVGAVRKLLARRPPTPKPPPLTLDPTLRADTLEKLTAPFRERVLDLLNDLLREETLREKIATLGTRTQDLEDFFDASLGFVAQVVHFDVAAVFFHFKDDPLILATRGAWPSQYENGLLQHLLAGLDANPSGSRQGRTLRRFVFGKLDSKPRVGEPKRWLSHLRV
ncbi:MAG: response regulator, partial [Candidatus Riflebacteria bacterium]|nr:response regulator [Candidatus Riflebacteria bacterium]